MAEFSIIDQFCTGIGSAHSATDIAVGDDAAVINIPNDMRMAISVDTMVAGVHFYPDAAPETIAHKLLAVNLSDMAAMGALPKWATMTLTAPDVDTDWLAAFSNSLDSLAKHYNVQLIGGDTTQGQLNLSMQIMGLLPKSKALTRNGAKIGDDVYVSNTIGDAALALRCLQLEKHVSEKPIENQKAFKGLLKPNLLRFLEQPNPQLELGVQLLNVANSCIDVSDGLLADLSHIAQKSAVSIEIDVAKLPLSTVYQDYIAQGGNPDLALTGGDDYQLAFSAPIETRDAITRISGELNIPITRIGCVTKRNADDSLLSLRSNGGAYQLSSNAGYQHFKPD